MLIYTRCARVRRKKGKSFGCRCVATTADEGAPASKHPGESVFNNGLVVDSVSCWRGEQAERRPLLCRDAGPVTATLNSRANKGGVARLTDEAGQRPQPLKTGERAVKRHSVASQLDQTRSGDILSRAYTCTAVSVHGARLLNFHAKVRYGRMNKASAYPSSNSVRIAL